MIHQWKKFLSKSDNFGGKSKIAVFEVHELITQYLLDKLFTASDPCDDTYGYGISTVRRIEKVTYLFGKINLKNPYVSEA